MKRTLLIAFALTSIFCLETLGQRKFVGRVVDVVDGKTVVIETNAGRITTVMQYIDVPEPEQPLYQTVKDHLRKLLLGKTVDFNPQGIGTAQTLGQLYLGSTDVAQQMIRDGAAWHIPPDRSGQSTREGAIYEDQQIQARAEKRGVWSIANLKPAWQARAEREEKLRLEKIEREEAAKKAEREENEKRAVRIASSNPKKLPAGIGAQSPNDIWVDINANPYKQTYGLHRMAEEKDGMPGVVSTSPEFVYLFSGEARQKLSCRAVYTYVEGPDGKMQSVVMLGFWAISSEQHFSKQKNSMALVADGRRTSLQPFLGVFKHEYYGVQERMVFIVPEASFRKIANAKNVEVVLDNKYKGKFASSTLELFKQLANAM